MNRQQRRSLAQAKLRLEHRHRIFKTREMPDKVTIYVCRCGAVRYMVPLGKAVTKWIL